MDILTWGPRDAKSATYWVSFGVGTFEVFCDMDTDNGGWTLFFNYIHVPGDDLRLNASVVIFYLGLT